MSNKWLVIATLGLYACDTTEDINYLAFDTERACWYGVHEERPKSEWRGWSDCEYGAEVYATNDAGECLSFSQVCGEITPAELSPCELVAGCCEGMMGSANCPTDE